MVTAIATLVICRVVVLNDMKAGALWGVFFVLCSLNDDAMVLLYTYYIYSFYLFFWVLLLFFILIRTVCPFSILCFLGLVALFGW